MRARLLRPFDGREAPIGLLAADAADAARAINFVELDDATAIFDRADVRQRLAALCVPAPAPAPAPPAEDDGIIAAASDDEDDGAPPPAKRPMPSPTS